ncbi:FAD-binding domain protein [Rhizoctonia solani AG-3 Rhs1AP]|uniref:FAD-binding domain protein n=1 Tax=Rhizoctonia solani AG-3 Rhs1AP TaxID=1086054 RepID=X8JD05_9AGAM|nr:FAD-binding domain protein [Rhizoctonia solani AG-3 Rhs1AP]
MPVIFYRNPHPTQALNQVDNVAVEVSDDEFNAFQTGLPESQVLLAGNISYERTVFVGNLLYRLKSPSVTIRPGNEDEVVRVVNFCRDNGVHLTVKNGGHSYAAHGLNDSGIVMCMDKLNRVSINEDSSAVTIGAGAIWKHVYDQFVGRNKANIVVGGQCPYVGVSGFTMGGGLSPFSRSYGLGIDNVLEIRVVTANGDIQTIVKAINPEGLAPEEMDNDQKLLWGVCGGGGGNFGVLLEFKSRVYPLNNPSGQVVCGQLIWNLRYPESRARFNAALAAFNAMDCPNALTVDGLWRANGDELKGYLTVIYNGTWANCIADLAGFVDLNMNTDEHLGRRPDVVDLKEMMWSDWVHKEDGWGLKSGIFHRHISFILGQDAITPAFVNQVYGLMETARTRFPKAHLLWGSYWRCNCGARGECHAVPLAGGKICV